MELLIWLVVVAVLISAGATGVAAWARAKRGRQERPVRAGVRNGLVGLAAFTVIAGLVVGVGGTAL